MNAYEEYKKLVAKKEELDFLIETVKAEIIKDMKSRDAVKEVFDYGSFTLAKPRVTYTYTPAVKVLEDKVKLKKLEEQQKGIATIKSVTEYMLYTPNKQ